MLKRTLCAAIVVGALLARAQTTRAESKPRIFITDSQSWEIMGSAGGTGGTFAAHTQGGARPQTAEIIKTFGERCPQVIVNNKQEKADYIVLLDHEGGKGIARKRNKVAVFNKDGDAVVSRSTRSLGNSVQDACAAIANDWAAHTSASQTTPAAPPKSTETTALPNSSPGRAGSASSSQPASLPTVPATQHLVAPAQPTPSPQQSPKETSAAEAATGLVSITSTPDGAEIFVDSIGRGRAPQILKLSPGEHTVQLVADSYKDWSSKVTVKADSIVNVMGSLDKR